MMMMMLMKTIERMMAIKMMMIKISDLDWVSDVLPGGDKSHADEEDDEGGSVVQFETKVVNRGRIGLPGRQMNLRTSVFLKESESGFNGILKESEREYSDREHFQNTEKWGGGKLIRLVGTYLR